MPSHLQVGQHAQQAPQQAAVDGLAAALPLDEHQDPVDGFTLDLQVADDVEPEQLQTHVPAEQSGSINTHLKPRGLELFVEEIISRRSLTRSMAALSFVKRRCGPETKIYS